MFSNALSKRKGFLWLSLVTALLTLLTGFFLWSSVQTHSVVTIREHIHQWQPVLAGIRWTVISGLALGWPGFCRWLVRSGRISIDKAQQMKALRWRIVGWLVVIELILGQSLLVKLTAIMVSKNG
ncbi:MAG: hypothetical protein COA75_08515 [Cellvibrionales bacterium]|nr:MAG: hypothetical protein COA75_08515 [Cellvibrionales bacterium]